MDFIISDGRIWNIPFLSLPSEFEFRFVVPVFHRYARNEMFANVSRFHCRMKDSTKSRWWASLVLWNGAWKRLSLWIIQRPMKNSRNERQSKLHRAHKEIRIIVHIGWAEASGRSERGYSRYEILITSVRGVRNRKLSRSRGGPLRTNAWKLGLPTGQLPDSRLTPIFVFPSIKICFDMNAIPSCRWSSMAIETSREKKERRRRKMCIFILIYANTKRVSLLYGFREREYNRIFYQPLPPSKRRNIIVFSETSCFENYVISWTAWKKEGEKGKKKKKKSKNMSGNPGRTLNSGNQQRRVSGGERNKIKRYVTLVPPLSVFRPLLKQIKNSAESHIVLDCSTERIYDVLKQAQQIGMMSDYHSYLITSLVSPLIKWECN